MSSLNWFRFEVSGSQFRNYSAYLSLFFLSIYFVGHADDYDGDGYDDDTGEWVGDDGGYDDYTSDSDGDSLSDYDEENFYYTDPNMWDSDSDGYGDGDEITAGTDPNDSASNEGSMDDGSSTDDYTSDSDGDFLSDYDEENTYFTDPSLWDTDGDGYGDGDEINSGTDPNDSASFDGGWDDGGGDSGSDSDSDGLSDDEESGFHGTDPNDDDSDDDGLSDGQEVNGVEISVEYEEYSYTEYYYDDTTGEETSYDVYETYSYTTTVYPNPLNFDSDSDLLPDGYEFDNGLNPMNSSDGTVDGDGDGLTRGEEYIIGTSRFDSDTDDDGINDGTEVIDGTDPLDPDSPGTTGGGDTGGGDTGGGDTGGGDTGGGDTGGGDTGIPADPGDDPGGLNQGDRDNDGLWDAWEFRYFGGKSRFTADSDPDADGLTNLEELAAGTHPNSADTDGDGLNDGDEIALNTDPRDADTDGDGYEDGWEANNGLDPADSSDITTDTDSNSIPDAYELFHSVYTNFVYPSDDADADGLFLGTEVPDDSSGEVPTEEEGLGYYDPMQMFQPVSQGEFNHRTYPDRADSDGDGLSDLDELFPVFVEEYEWDDFSQTEYPTGNYLEWFSSPTKYDTDGDGYSDKVERDGGSNPSDPWSVPSIDFEADADSDGLSDFDELFFGTDSQLADTDGDGFTDYEEAYLYGTDPLDTNDFWVDTDGDGLSDSFEISVLGTDPNLADSDGDGVNDDVEIYSDETDPLDAAHFWVDADSDGLRDDLETYLGLDTSTDDSDGDGLTDEWEFYNGSDPFTPDVDDLDEGLGDGMLDVWETANYLDPEDLTDAFADPDEDALTNLEEFQHGTDPWSSDTDYDWLRDDLEIRIYGTDPLNWDTDGDGSADGLELFWYGTNPLDPNSVVVDADEDWIPDDWETANGLDPTDPYDAYQDSDGDGLLDGVEYWLGGDPNNADTDGDGRTDGAQWADGDAPSSQSNFVDKVTESGQERDFDGDGLSDAYESSHGLDVYTASDSDDPDADGLTNLEELALGTDPNDADTDEDDLSDKFESETSLTDPLVADTDGDGLNDGIENAEADFDPLDPADGLADGDNDGATGAQEFLAGSDPALPDTDGDQLTDGWEIANGTDPLIADNVEDYDADDDGIVGSWELQYGLDQFDIDDGAEDWDNDGLTNLEEFENGTDPNDADTDGDDLLDGWEVAHPDTDPLVADDADAYDGDDDGMLGSYESFHGFDRTDGSDGAFDADGDGLTNAEEAALNTNPHLTDTDNDGLTDDFESGGFYVVTNDGTGWSYYITDATVADSDGDGILDGAEYTAGTAPITADKFGSIIGEVSTSPQDLNFNNIPDDWESLYAGAWMEIYDEFGNVTDGYFEIQMSDSTDYDEDGLNDYEEYLLGTDPTDTDSDDDGLLDNEEVIGYEVEVYYEMTEESITYEYDDVTGEEYEVVEYTTYEDGPYYETMSTDPANPDTDGDLLMDGDEITLGMNPLDPLDGESDTDNDDLTFAMEYYLGTDPNLPDTDGDELPDGWEVAHGFDPLDPNDGLEDEDSDGIDNKTAFQQGGAAGVFGSDASYYWNSSNFDHLTDTDGDGVSNRLEAIAGTGGLDPNDGGSGGDGGGGDCDD